MPYEPRNEPHLRYVTEPKTKGEEHKKLMKTIHDYTIKLNEALGYDFNTVEFAIRNGVPYAIDFCNPAPDADINSVGQTNFDWIVEHSAQLAVEKALAHKGKQNNTSWGTFLTNAITPLKPKVKKSKLKTANQIKKSVIKKEVTAAAKKVKKVSAKKTTPKKVVKPAPKVDAKPKVAVKPKAAAKKTVAKPKAVTKPKVTVKPKVAVKKTTVVKPKAVTKPKAAVKKTVTKPKTTPKKK